MLLKFLTNHLKSKAESFLGKGQYGFRKGCDARDAIAAFRVLYERSLENDNKLYVCFVDYERSILQSEPVQANDDLREWS